MPVPLHVFSQHVPRMLHYLAVVEARSINKAARSLNISQPALSRSIRSLEHALGMPLLDRSVKGVTPTALGQMLLNHVRTINVNLSQTSNEVEAFCGNRTGEIAVGVTPAANSLVTGAIELIQCESPKLKVRAIESASPDLFALVRTGELDMYIGPAARTPEPDMTEEPLFTERFALWARSNHPLLRRRNLQFRDLAAEAWIVPHPESTLRSHLDAELRRAKISLTGSITETSSLLLVKTLLVGGNRIALLSPAVLSAEHQAGVVKKLKGRWSFPSRSYCIFTRQRRSRTPPMHAFIRALKTIARGTSGRL